MSARGRITLGFTLMLVLAVFLAGCRGSASAETSDRLTEIIRSGKIRVCYAPEVPPIIFKDPQTGEPSGLAMDLNRGVAESLNVELVPVESAWSGLIPALQAGNCDYIGSGMCKMHERAQSVNFTAQNDFLYTVSLMTKEDNPNFTSLEDFNSADVTIGALVGSGTFTNAQQGFPQAHVEGFESTDLAALAVMNGQIDAAIEATTTWALFAQAHPETKFKLWRAPGADCVSGMIVPAGPEYDHLLRYLDNYLRYVKVDGEYQKMYEKWLPGVEIPPGLYW